MKKLFLVLASILTIGLTQVQAQAATLTAGIMAGADIYGTIKYQDFINTNTQAINAVSINNTGIDFSWLKKENYKFVINYSKDTNKLSTTIKLDNNDNETVYKLSTTIVSDKNINYLNFFKQNSTGAFNIKNLKLDDSILTESLVNGSWYLFQDFNQDFRISGKLAINGNISADTVFETRVGHADTPVPEPSTMVLGALGLGGLLARRRKKA